MKVYLEIIALCEVREAQLRAYRITGLESILHDAHTYEKCIKERFNGVQLQTAGDIPIDTDHDSFYAEVARYCQITLADLLD